uniref:REM-1 domain-containing protein n=1 Tax=Timema tahoe TaxID=61484 RepID=A0A7R9IIX7_9NEOP|nr:unnamed protein product [Timema tahoe]
MWCGGEGARNTEFDLEQKIDLEIKMREGTTKLLAACRHQTQTLEAAKNLVTSNERMSAYMAELQRRKKEPSRGLGTPDPDANLDFPVIGSLAHCKSSALDHVATEESQKINVVRYSTQPCTARVSLSDLRMPLMWRDTDHFKNKGDYRRFAVFCLARIGTEIYDTALLCPVDRALTDITFPDVLLFNQIPADFEFRLEVYSHILQDDLSIASTPRKIKKTIHSSISRTVGKKLAASLRDELNSGKIGPHFELMAMARLTLADVHDSIHTHDMKLENVGKYTELRPRSAQSDQFVCHSESTDSEFVNNETEQEFYSSEIERSDQVGVAADIDDTNNKSHQLPLFGHFCCRLAAQPDCVSQEVCAGTVECQGQWYWGQLQAFRLDLWMARDHWEAGQDPLRSITIDRDTAVRPSLASSKELVIVNQCEGKEEKCVIRTKTSEEQQRWTRNLVQHCKDHLRWKHAAEKIMEIQSPGSTRHSFTRGLRQGSLYDETPLIESVSASEFHRPTVQEIFGMTPSTSLSSCASSSSSPTFRERSLSSGGSGKTRGGTVRVHWPFGRNNQE